jgi:hypothetical protein
MIQNVFSEYAQDNQMKSDWMVRACGMRGRYDRVLLRKTIRNKPVRRLTTCMRIILE